MSAAIVPNQEIFSLKIQYLQRLNGDNPAQPNKDCFIGNKSHFCVNVIAGLNLLGNYPKYNFKKENSIMKNKALIATGLITLALLAGCSKEKETTSTTTSVTTPAPEPAATKTEESTSTTTIAPAGEPATTTQESTTTTTTTPATEGK